MKHIGFGPLKKENQDEYFVQVGGFGGQKEASCYAIFDGHGSYGRNAAAFCCRELPALLDQELRRAFQQAAVSGRPAAGRKHTSPGVMHVHVCIIPCAHTIAAHGTHWYGEAPMRAPLA